MAENSKIEWTDHTWNPWQGCKKVSPGCKYCYMYRDKKRYGQNPMTVIKSSLATFNKPLTWKDPAKVFTCSWSDFFIDQADEWRGEAWDIIRQTPHLTYQILTKRPENIKDRLPEDWGYSWPNVWLGVSVENNDYIWRIDELYQIPAMVRFVSYEPALGPLNIHHKMEDGMIDWLISGGESGPAARPAIPFWFRQIQIECDYYAIPYFHKQNGGNKKINGAWGGRELDGKIYNKFPSI